MKTLKDGNHGNFASVSQHPSGRKSHTQLGVVFHFGSIPSFYSGEGNGKPLRYSCLENPINSIKGKKIGH